MKPLLEFVRTLLFVKPAASSGSIWVYVRCNDCGEALRARINLQNDLSVEYGRNPRKDRYHTHKVVMGSGPCFRRIYLSLEFDAQKRIIAEEIHGGTRIKQQEYHAPDEDSVSP